MTPKEKAEELVLKMVDTYNITSDFCYDSTAKACALIAVDEILSVILYIYETYEERKYWQQVKEEIENL
jgi:hypothetical protein